MLSIETLETQMDAVVRGGLRAAMQHINVINSADLLSEVKARLSEYLQDSLQDQIQETYTEGYAEGGRRIQQRTTTDAAYAMKRVMTPLGDALEIEDPRIAKATTAAIEGIQYLLDGQKEAIQDIILTQFAQGATTSQIAASVAGYFDDNRIASERFARTLVTDIYTSASYARYVESGVVDGIEFSAHIDAVTTAICEMLNGTIWALGDPGIRRPPLHFSCRSDIYPYFGVIPGARDFDKEFGSKYVEAANETADTFRDKYWTPMLDSLRNPLATGRRAVDAAYARIGR